VWASILDTQGERGERMRIGNSCPALRPTALATGHPMAKAARVAVLAWGTGLLGRWKRGERKEAVVI
jgi:hypothetical protein